MLLDKLPHGCQWRRPHHIKQQTAVRRPAVVGISSSGWTALDL